MVRKPEGISVAGTGGGENGVLRGREIEKVLNSNFALEALDNIQISHDNLTSDIHASAAYRANLIKEMAKKGLQELI